MKNNLWEVEYIPIMYHSIRCKGHTMPGAETPQTVIVEAEDHLDAKEKFHEGNCGQVLWCRELKENEND